MRYRAILLTALLLLTAGCNKEDENRIISAVTYSCEDGSHLFVQYRVHSAWVDPGNGNTLSLPKQNVDSGILYSSGQHELSGTEKKPTWTMGRRAPTTCQLNG
jgi:hypothetical protein